MVGERIKIIRESLGATMASFANMIGATPGAVNNWEKNVREPSVVTLVEIAKVGGRSLDWLLVGEINTKEDQYKAIVELSVKLKEVKDENEKLKKQLSGIQKIIVVTDEPQQYGKVADKNEKYSNK